MRKVACNVVSRFDVVVCHVVLADIVVVEFGVLGCPCFNAHWLHESCCFVVDFGEKSFMQNVCDVVVFLCGCPKFLFVEDVELWVDFAG